MLELLHSVCVCSAVPSNGGMHLCVDSISPAIYKMFLCI